MDKRLAVRAAGVGLGVAAFAAGAAHPALATGPAHASYSTLGSSAVFAAHPDHDVALDAQARINALATWADTLAAKVAALPSTMVATGRERMHLLFKLAVVKHALARIDVMESATSPLTATQKAQLASVAATLGEVKTKLLTILANAPAPSTAKTVTFSRTATFAGDSTRHHCDGTWSWGSRDGSWNWWDGSRDGRHSWWH